MKCTCIEEKEKCNWSCFEIDQEMDAILLIIGIVYGVCRIVIKSVQQCTYFLFSVKLLLVSVNYEQRICKFAVNKRQNTNYSFLPVTSKVSCILWKRGQIICLQGNNKSMEISFSKGEKWYDKLLSVKYLPLFHHFTRAFFITILLPQMMFSEYTISSTNWNIVENCAKHHNHNQPISPIGSCVGWHFDMENIWMAVLFYKVWNLVPIKLA